MFVEEVQRNENLGAPSAAASCAVQWMLDSFRMTDASYRSAAFSTWKRSCALRQLISKDTRAGISPGVWLPA